MASYTRQSTFADGDLITAALFNNEYNQLVSAFDNATGHKHDGTIGEGPVISVLGDAGLETPLNKILIDTINDHIEFYINVSETSTQQLYIADGAIVPTIDNDIDLGTNSLQFKDLYINGTANIDSLVADTADINGGTIDGVTIGGTSAGAITGTTITGTSFVIGSATITETELEILDGATLSTTELNYVGGVTSNIQTQIDTKAPLSSPNLTGIPTAPTAAANTNTTQVATTAYVQTEITDLIGAAPGTLDTLNELAAAINNDANYNTTLTTALATKLPLAGGTMTGNVTYGDNVKANFGTSEDLQIYHDGSNSYITDVGTGNLIITGNLTGNVTGNVTGTVSDISNHSTSDLSEGTNLYYTDARFDTRLATKDTDDVSEGTSNLYYTDARVQNVSINNVVEDTTPQLGGTLDLNSNNITGTGNIDVTGTVTSDGLTVDTGTNAIINGSSGEGLQFQRGGISQVRIDSVNNDGGVYHAPAGKNHTFKTDGVNRVKFATGGDISFYDDTGTTQGLFWDASAESLGIGTTSPTTTLDVNGTIKYESLSDGTITITGFADEDDMVSNSATLLPTQQSVKAYVDSQVSSAGGNGISFADNEKAQFGDGNDLQIYHDGSDSFVSDAGTGRLILRGSSQVRLETATGTQMISADDGGAAKLYHNGIKKLDTTSTGIDVTGTATMDGLTVVGESIFGTATGVFPDEAVLIRGNNGTSGYINGLGVGSSNSQFRIFADDTNNTAGSIKFDIRNRDRILIEDNGDISFYEDTGTSQALFWDASAESLGIGTTSPSAPLHITQESNAISGTNVDVSNLGLKIINPQNDNNEAVGMGFALSTASSNIGAAIIHQRDDVQSRGSLSFATKPALGEGADIPIRMTISSDGDVGIGTVSPNARLEIKPAASSNYLQFNDSSDTEKFRIDSNFRWAWGTTTPTQDFDMRNTSGNAFFALDRGNERVGIGTTSPSTKLMLEHNNDGAVGGTIRIKDRDSQQDANQLTGAIEFESEDATTPTSGVSTAIKAFAASSTGGSYLTISTTDISTSTLDERMRIDSSGNVGIGTASPNELLSINSTASTARGISIDQSGAERVKILYTNSSGAFDINNTTAGYTSFTNNGSEAMRITSAGNVGIGTSSPNVYSNITGLTIDGTSGSLVDFEVNGTLKGEIFASTAAMNISAYGTHYIAFTTTDSGIPRMRIDSSGNVGIGTTSPQEKLHVNSGSTNEVARFESSDSTAYLSIIDNSTSTSLHGIGAVGNNLTFYGNNAERMRIDSSGNLLVGTTTNPNSRKLRVYGISEFDGNGVSLQVFNSSGTKIGSAGQGNYVVSGGSSTGYGIQSQSDLVFGSGGTTERMRITSSGNVGIGTSSPTAKLTIGGITGVDGLSLEQQSTSTDYSARLFFNSSNATATLVGRDGGLGFYTGSTIGSTTGSERMRLDASGNLLVGTTSTSPWTAATNSSADNGIALRSDGIFAASASKSTANSGNVALFNRTGTDGPVCSFLRNGSTVGSIGTQSARLTIGTGDTGLRFVGDADQITPWNLSTNSTSNGLLDLGNTNNKFKDLYLSGGLRGDTTFKNNAGTTEYARFDSSGNLLVGTTNTVLYNNTTANTGGGAFIKDGLGTRLDVSRDNTCLTLNRPTTDGLMIDLYKGTTNVGGIGVAASNNLYIGALAANHAGLYFSDDGANGVITPIEAGSLIDNSVSLGSGSYRFKDLYLSGQANVGSVLATGDVTAYSDERLKDNIQTLQGSKVLEMRGVSFTKDGKASSGVIAQEIEKVAPELVHTAKDEMGTKSVAYGNLVGYLIEAIKEQQKEIEYMKSEIKTLKENK